MKEKEYEKLKNLITAMDGRMKAEMASQRMDMNERLAQKMNVDMHLEYEGLKRRCLEYDEMNERKERLTRKVRRIWYYVLFMGGVTVGEVVFWVMSGMS